MSGKEVENKSREERIKQLYLERSWEKREVCVGGVRLERVRVLRCLGMDMGEEGGMKEEADHIVAEGIRALSGLGKV